MDAKFVREQSQLRNRLERMFSQTANLICTADFDWNFKDINPAFEKLLGFTQEELLSKPLIEFIHTEDREAMQAAAAGLAEGREVVGLVNRCQCQDGSWRWLSWNATSDLTEQLVYAVAHDMTEGRKAEQLLRESEKRYHNLFKEMVEGFAVHEMIYDEDGAARDYRFIEVNPAFEKLTGLPADQVVGRTAIEVLPGLQPEWIDTYGRVAMTGVPVVFENYAEPLHRYYHVVAYSPERGKFATIFTDITDRKLAEEALRTNEQLYRAIGESIDYGVWICEPDGRNIYASESFLKLVGITQEQCSNFGWADTLHPDDKERTIAAWKEFTRTGGIWDIEHRFRGVDGQWHPILARGVPVRNEQGEIIQYAGINLDISRMAQTEGALRQNAQRLAGINRLDHVISSSLDIGTVYDAFVVEMKELLQFDRTSILLLDEAGENWQILRQWNAREPAFMPGTWYPLKGTALDWVVQHQRAYLEQTLGEQANWPEHAGLRQEGIECTVILPLILMGKVTGLLTLASRQPNAYQPGDLELLQMLADQLAIALQNANLYDQVRLTAEELEQRVQTRTAQLEKANQDLESFSYTVSHDLRAPLRAINGFSQILASRHRGSLEAEGQHYLDNVVEASTRMGILIDDLLLYSRVGRASVRRQTVSLEALLEQVLGDLSQGISETQATVFLPTPGRMPSILSDPTILSQIFTNIIGNALTYHRPGISPEIRVSYLDDQDHHLIGIADNGIGIAPEYLERIFNVFQRLHSTEEYPGTGIGLAIVKKSADILGGRVWAESTEGQGSTFWLQLPKEE